MTDVSPQDERSSPGSAASEQAAAWFARQRSGRWSEGDAAEFDAWLQSGPTQSAAWASYLRLWKSLEAVRDHPQMLALREQARQSVASRYLTGRAWLAGAALAASVLLGTAVWFVAAGWIRTTGRGPAGGAAVLIRDASTDIGERSELVLADGSKVTLNTASAVHADYSGPERRITLLRGEAFFEVAKNAERPFVVIAGSRQVVAVGTVFDVRLLDARLRVTLVEGRVRVAPGGPAPTAATGGSQPVSAVTLEAGSSLTTREDGSALVERVDTLAATSWRTGRLIIDGEPLSEVVAEMNRYTREKLEIANPALESRKVSGVFETTSGPAFGRALEAAGIARVRYRTATTIVLDSPR